MAIRRQDVPSAEEVAQRITQLLQQNARDSDPFIDPDLATTDYPILPLSRNIAKISYDDRRTPYYLRGRGDEFNFLARRLIFAPAPLALVTGPPGIGKSALLSAVQNYARRIGHYVVRIEPEELANRATIAQKCRDAVMAESDAPGHTRIDSTKGIRASIRAQTNDEFAKLGLELQVALADKKSREALGAVDLLKHLRAVCQYNNRQRRLLIVCDEVQKVQETLERDTQAIISLQTNLGVLNDAILDEAMPLPITTVLAGLDPARSIVEKIISRFANESDIQLTPIAPEYGRQILQDYLNIDGQHVAMKTFFKPEQLDRWGNECHGHVIFASQLGQHLQDYARAAIPKDSTHAEPEDIRAIDTKFEELKTEYYNSRLPSIRIATEKTAHLLVHHLAALCSPEHTCHETQPDAPPQPMTWETIDTITTIVLLPQFPDTHPDHHDFTQARQQIIDELQRRGIIRAMDVTKQFLLLNQAETPKPNNRFVFPIPSMLSHLADQSLQFKKKTRDVIRGNVRRMREELGPELTQLNTRWHWNNVWQRTAILRVPPDPNNPPILYETTPTARPARRENEHGQLDPYTAPRDQLPTIYDPQAAKQVREQQ